MEEQVYDNKLQGGYIAIMSVLVLGAVGSLLVFSILQWGMVDTSIVNAISKSHAANGVAHGCAEEILLKIANTSLASETGTMTISTGTCTYSLTSPTPTTRTVQAKGVFENAVARVEVKVSSIVPKITIDQWKELATF